jgi:hypothetical protein
MVRATVAGARAHPVPVLDPPLMVPPTQCRQAARCRWTSPSAAVRSAGGTRETQSSSTHSPQHPERSDHVHVRAVRACACQIKKNIYYSVLSREDDPLQGAVYSIHRQHAESLMSHASVLI